MTCRRSGGGMAMSTRVHVNMSTSSQAREPAVGPGGLAPDHVTAGLAAELPYALGNGGPVDTDK